MMFHDFLEQYKPIPTTTPTFFEYDGKTYGWVTTIMGQAPQLGYTHTWTIVDTEEDLVVVPGIHRVNVMGYVFTEQPWTNEDIQNDLEIYL
ncbi:hypothetical protein CZP2022_82 [Vibrio phage C-ZP2022]|nr:hypothetical protein [Vibrio phage vB_pir03]UKZ10805.1 hypothetical protein CZP2022_82 [Vibrio phage C-ZP2022]